MLATNQQNCDEWHIPDNFRWLEGDCTRLVLGAIRARNTVTGEEKRNRNRDRVMRAIADVFRQFWPLAGVSFALLATVAWVGFLGYGLSRLGVLPF